MFMTQPKTKMTETPEPSIFEKRFAKSDKTDAILVVDGKKLHVNKGLLSYHSDYFYKLFNSEFKEKSMEEIPIEDVNFEHFAILLSIAQNNPIRPTEYNAEKILELADRFLLPCVKPYLEMILIPSLLLTRMAKIRIGDKYELSDLIKKGICEFNDRTCINITLNTTEYLNLSDKTKIRLLTHLVINVPY